MNNVAEIIKWVTENYQAIIAGAIAVLTGLAMLAKLTKSPKDDAFVAKILEFLNLIPKRSDGTLVTRPPLTADYYSKKFATFYARRPEGQPH